MIAGLPVPALPSPADVPGIVPSVPNVPGLPGVPSLPSLPDIPLPDISLGGLAGGLDSALGGILGGQAEPEWYLMDEDGGTPVAFTSFISMELRAEGKVVSAPVEEGSFASYNKVSSPLSIKCTLGIMGDDAELQAALHVLSILQEDTLLLSLVTPNAEYENLNLVSYNYQRRREDGLGVLYVELQLEEIRQVTVQYTNAELSPRKERGLQQVKEVPSESAQKEISALKGIANIVTG